MGLNLPPNVTLQYIPVKPGGSQGSPKEITGGDVSINPASESEAAGIQSVRIERSDGSTLTTDNFLNIFVEACLEGELRSLFARWLYCWI